MEKVRPWCGQLSDRGRLKNRTEQKRLQLGNNLANCKISLWQLDDCRPDLDETNSRHTDTHMQTHVHTSTRTRNERVPKIIITIEFFS